MKQIAFAVYERTEEIPVRIERGYSSIAEIANEDIAAEKAKGG
jgi:hypothetical protein